MYSKVCSFLGYTSYTNSRKSLTTGSEMSHESRRPMKSRRCIGRFMYSIALLASSMAPCRIVLASQLIEKISLEYNNHSITHQNDKYAVEQFFVNYNKRGHILAVLVASSSVVVPRQGAVVNVTMHLFFNSFTDYFMHILSEKSKYAANTINAIV